MDYKTERFRITCTWQVGSSVFDREQKQFECAYKSDIQHLLRIEAHGKQDFKYWIERITTLYERIKDITL